MGMSGLTLLMLTVAALTVVAVISHFGNRPVRAHPEPAAHRIAQDLARRGKLSAARRVIKRNTEWSWRLSQRYVLALAQGRDETHLPDVIDDYPELPRDVQAWVGFLMAEGHVNAAVAYVASRTDWTAATSRAYLRRFDLRNDDRNDAG